ncbi:MAG TPA: hypothetical protein VFP22_06520 [Candidatus Limnocylindrales bacterium]|nr:hypothetical protein [Candidatus Limnocylindrales bacterium]
MLTGWRRTFFGSGLDFDDVAIAEIAKLLRLEPGEIERIHAELVML